MSAEPAVQESLGLLAPGFHQVVLAVLADCAAAGLDAVVYETLRTPERQAWLYAEGRTRAGDVVTEAASALRSWHGYGLAVDVISKARRWSQPDSWWQTLAVIAERHGLTSGYRWHSPHDPPHLQWGACPTGPTAADRRLAEAQGLAAVWARYGADQVTVPSITPAVVAPLEAPAAPPNRAPVPAPVYPHTETLAMAENEGGIKEVVKEALTEVLTEENTDKVINELKDIAETVLPDVPCELVAKMLDALLPKYLILAIDKAL